MPLPDKPLIVILGPTAVGKTELSIQLAERLNGEIISADSRLFYRGMDIGTAKPSLTEQARVPHYLIDVADPDEVWSLAKFQRQAYLSINNIHSRAKIPFLVGGTGQYVKAVYEGWDIPEVKPDRLLRKALENWAVDIGSLGLYQRLKVLDPAAAERIDPANLRRTIRALEVILHTGKLFSTQKRRSGSPYRTLLLGLTRPRPELYARVDERIQLMLDQGLLTEVQTLIAAGYSPDLPPMSAIGYRQMIQHLHGEISLEEAVMLMKRITRQFVRRQANWFKIDDPDIHWFAAESEPIAEMENCIRQFLDEFPFAGM